MNGAISGHWLLPGSLAESTTLLLPLNRCLLARTGRLLLVERDEVQTVGVFYVFPPLCWDGQLISLNHHGKTGWMSPYDISFKTWNAMLSLWHISSSGILHKIWFGEVEKKPMWSSPCPDIESAPRNKKRYEAQNTRPFWLNSSTIGSSYHWSTVMRNKKLIHLGTETGLSSKTRSPVSSPWPQHASQSKHDEAGRNSYGMGPKKAVTSRRREA